MKTVLLAGGKSQRMEPLSNKVLLEFCGKPLLQHQVDSLRKAGLSDIVVVGGKHILSDIESLLQDSAIELVPQEEDTGMKGAVMACEKVVSDNPFVVVSSNDIVDEKAFSDLAETVKAQNIDGAIVSRKVDGYFPGGYLETDPSLRIKSIVEKPGEGNQPSDLINLVVHFHKNPDLLYRNLSKMDAGADDLYEQALHEMFQESTYQAVPYEGFWQALKYPWHVLDVMENFLQTISEPVISEKAQIAPTAVINGPVIISEGVKVFDGAIINGPCFIGKNAVIANHSLVRGSMIGENCVIGAGSEVARSYLRRNVWTHQNFIGDSVIDENVSFGAGTVTGNLRLDEGDIGVNIKGEKLSSGKTKFGAVIGSNTRVGINVSLMPGVKIGKNTVIGPGTTIYHDIDDNMFVKGAQELKIVPNKIPPPKARGVDL